APPEISSWISANCHLVGGGKQMCSEEIAIVAGGDRIHRVPPLVNALLLPDMPVAVWWMGDLPNEHEEYVETLLEPADRLLDGSSASISRDRERGVLMTNVDGTVSVPESVTRTIEKQTDALIVRQLKQSSGDRVLARALPMAARLAKRLK